MFAHADTAVWRWCNRCDATVVHVVQQREFMTTQQIASRYNVLKTLGEGGMGLVSLVEDTTNGQQVALKVLSSKIGMTEETLLQFKQEFRTMTQLRHPNCCAVYDYGVLPGGAPYLTMEVVPGCGLDALLPLDSERFLNIFSQLLLALGYVHQQGFVHCDIKDENARVKPDGEVKLMDFGLMERSGRMGGAIKGTLGYMAPEMIRGGRLDQRADLYSVGALGYQMLTGTLPFPHTEPAAIIKAHLSETPRSPAELNNAIEARFERIVMRLLQKEPVARYQSAYEVLEDLGVDVPEGIGGNLLSAPFVGRTDELAQMTSYLKSIRANKPGAALVVSGPAGMGKTRLVEEFRFAVQMENLPFVVGASFENGTAPYGPFVELLRGLLPVFREQLPEMVTRHAPIVGKLLPEWARVAGVTELAPDLDPPSKEKMRLQSTLSDLMAALALRVPLVLVLEDWQWADPLSVELLVYVLRNTKELPVMFIISHRATPDVNLGWFKAAVHLPLAPLTDSETAAMLTSMLGTEAVGRGFLEQITSFAEGNPFFVEGLLEHLVRNRTLIKLNGRWNANVELTPDQMPANLQGLLLEKLSALPEGAMAVARVGAVIGRELGLDVLKRVLSFDDNQLFDALGVLSETGIFTQTETGAYVFSQGQLQEVLYANLPIEERQALHLRVAQALEAPLAGLPLVDVSTAQVNAIANHYLLSSEAKKTVFYALEAGMRSANLFANADAIRFLTAGLVLLDGDPQLGGPTQRLSYLRYLGDVQRLSGKADVARDNLLRAIELAQDLGEHEQHGRMLTSVAKIYQVLNDYPSALDYCAQSFAVCLAHDDNAGAARCLLTSCRINFFTGKQQEAIEQTQRALELAQAAGVKTYVGEALGFAGLMYSSDPERLVESAENLNRSVAILSELNDKVGLNNSYNLLGNAQNMQGDFGGAWKSFIQTQRITFEIGLRDEEIFALINLAITAYELGNYADAIRMAKEAGAIAIELNSKFPLCMAMVLEAAACVYSGHLQHARQQSEEALALSREIKNKYMESLALQYQIEILVHLGCLEAAFDAGETLQALITETGNNETESRMWVALGEINGRCGRVLDGRVLADRALQASRLARARGVEARALRVSAWLYLLEDRLDDALAEATRACNLADAIGAQFQQALSLAISGEALLRLGRVEEAAQRFIRLQQVASQAGSALLRAQGLFGQAACNPYSRNAKHLMVEAQKLLSRLVEPLTEEARSQFLGLKERSRVIQGDFSTLMAQSESVRGREGRPAERMRNLSKELTQLAQLQEAQAQDLEASEMERERLEAVMVYLTVLRGCEGVSEIVAVALTRLMSLLGAERGFVNIAADGFKGQHLQGIKADGGYEADWAFAQRLCDDAKRAGAGILVEDCQLDERSARFVQEKNLMVQTAMAFPVRLSGAIVGELYVDRESSDGILFGEADFQFAQRLCDEAVFAAHRAALAADWQARSQQLQMLNQLAEKINETLVVSEVLELVVKLTLEVTHAERGFLMLRSETEPVVLTCKVALDRRGSALHGERISMSICNKVLNTGQAVTVVDATMDEEFQTAMSIMSLNLRTLMCVPLQAKGKSLGVLYVDSQAVVTTFNEKDLDLMRAIAGHASGAIENATLYTSLNVRAAELEDALAKYEKAEYDANTDMLTGLRNRRFFQEQSSREIDLSRRHHRHMSVILIDVDHFKKFNDTYGHAIGDEVLKVMGKVLPESVRVSDIAARFGGEEFVVLCPDTDAQGAVMVAERIREAVSLVRLFDLEGKPVRQITASLGVSSLMPQDQRLAEILERADTALYACKASGRNQVQVWREDMLTPEELKKKEAKESGEHQDKEASAR
jgi:diguanylate cyclase (GGDEF)-like protein